MTLQYLGIYPIVSQNFNKYPIRNEDSVGLHVLDVSQWDWEVSGIQSVSPIRHRIVYLTNHIVIMDVLPSCIQSTCWKEFSKCGRISGLFARSVFFKKFENNLIEILLTINSHSNPPPSPEKSLIVFVGDRDRLFWWPWSPFCTCDIGVLMYETCRYLCTYLRNTWIWLVNIL